MKKIVLILTTLILLLSSIGVQAVEIDKEINNDEPVRKIEIDTAIVHSINKKGSIEWLVDDEINIEKGSYPISIKWNITNHLLEDRGESYQFYFNNVAVKSNGKESETYIDFPVVESGKNEIWFYFLNPITVFSGLKRKTSIEIICTIGYFDSDDSFVFSKTIDINLERKSKENIENKDLTDFKNIFEDINKRFNDFILKVIPLSRFEPTYGSLLHQK